MNSITWGLIALLAAQDGIVAVLIRMRYIRATIGPESPEAERRRRLRELPLVRVVERPADGSGQ